MLDRSARTLSGGEAQRIRLATQIGSQLTGVLYILDEPSIGLHQRDDQRLIGSLRNLRDGGNSVIVVEHDKEMMMSADHLIDIGPGAGEHGGRIVAQGHPQRLALGDSITAQIPAKRAAHRRSERTPQRKWRTHRPARCTGQQPEGRGCGPSARQLHLRDGGERKWEEHLDRRHALPHPQQALLPQ